MTNAEKALIVADNFALSLMGKALEDKADIEYVGKVIINTFSGTTVPETILGKDGDIYKRYPSDTPVMVMDETSYADFNENELFEIFYDGTSPNLWQAKVHYTMNVLILKYGTNGSPEEHDYTLQIGNGTVYDLSVYSKNSASIMLFIPPTASNDLRSITTATNIRIASKQLTGRFSDYQKYNNLWFPNVVPFSRITSTVDFAHNSPTKTELVAIFDAEEHHDWAHAHDFFVNNAHGYYLVRYVPNGDTDMNGINYEFFFEALSKAT